MEPSMQKAIQELARGLDSANELREHLADDSFARMAPEAREGLLDEVLNSFLSALSTVMKGSYSGQSSMTTKSPRGQGHRRRQNTRTWTREDSPSPFADGYSWRKYGQKKIHRATHPREYFRCSYSSRSCEARKQVQKIQDYPPVYRTTYLGEHTCHSHWVDIPLATSGGYVGDCVGSSDMLISFDKPHDQNTRWPPTTSMKEEHLESDREHQHHRGAVQSIISFDDIFTRT